MQVDAQLPVRGGVFETVEHARAAVEGLLVAGFSPEQVTVVCSDEEKVRSLHDYEHQHPSGTFTWLTGTTGGTCGAIAAGLVVVVGMIATGATPAIVAVSTGIAALAGAVFGTLVGAMLSRGVERELADYYQQSVQEGKIVVAVKDTEKDVRRRIERLQHASRILEQAGSHPVSLPEG